MFVNDLPPILLHNFFHWPQNVQVGTGSRINWAPESGSVIQDYKSAVPYLGNHNTVYKSGDSFRDTDNCTCISVLLGNLGHPVVSAGLLVLYLDTK